MIRVNIHQAKTALSKLVAQVEAGEEIIVCRDQVPVAKLVPYHNTTHRRPKVGKITSAPIPAQADCFAPLTEKEMIEWGMA